ncbi:hypothetical protein BC835DRAFT_1381501 [Cytidiella melzeri]|nr:hypothetical protein BC835DRAFT_1381501 [Cytidiella melzeri]
MRFSTSLILSATVIIGTLHTMTASAVPHNRVESHYSSHSNNCASLKSLKTGTGSFTNPHHITKRMERNAGPSSQPFPAELAEIAKTWEKLGTQLFNMNWVAKGPADRTDAAEVNAWRLFCQLLRNNTFKETEWYKLWKEKVYETNPLLATRKKELGGKE